MQVQKEQIKFIKDKEQLGIVYDWNKIFKYYRALKCPDDCYEPTHVPMNAIDYMVGISKRSKGKTTGWLLIGLIMYLMYGTVTQYVRESVREIKPSVVSDIFKVIKTYNNGQYIRELTGGKYNSIYYHWKKCYLCYMEDGKRVETDPEHFFYFLSYDEHEEYKSGYNEPRGDLIILDEFITSHNRINASVEFMDLFRTIQRKRLCCKIVMLANTTDVNNIWFRDLCISKEAKTIKEGEHKKIVVNDTVFYFEYITTKLTNNDISIVKKFFGFAINNPKFAHLIDTGNAWSYVNVPHINYDKDDKYLDRTYRLIFNDEMIHLELVRKSNGMLVIYAHPTKDMYEDSKVLTLEEIKAPNEKWGFGYGKYCRLLWKLYQRNLWYYSDNETGAIVSNYVKHCRQMAL